MQSMRAFLSRMNCVFFQIIDMLNSIAWYAQANNMLPSSSQEVMRQIDQYWVAQSRQLIKDFSTL